MLTVIALAFFFLGVALLLKGADWLVTGASSIASIMKISPVAIGLTVVAFGTSSPELVVSIAGALSGNTDVTLGNIIGSNIANILLILGAAAMVTPLKVHKNTVWKEIPMSFLGGCLLVVLAFQEIIDSGHMFNPSFDGSQMVGVLTPSNGIVLLSFFIIFLYYTFGIAKVEAETGNGIEKHGRFMSIFLIVIGLVGLTAGSKLLIDNGITIARSLGVSDSFIGLTLVAFGTSLPELITSVVAAFKKKVDIAVGNVVGSNIFNIFLVLGTTTLVRPLPLSANYIADILVLFASTIVLFASLFVHKRHTITRLEGSFMLLSYFAYIAFLVVRG
jgi:cation:H+ antiporter